MSGTSYDNCKFSDVSNAGTVVMQCQVQSLGGGSSTNFQVFLHTPGAAGTPHLISAGTGGDSRGNKDSGYSLAIDASGLSLAFDSDSSNMVPDDTNNVRDIFVRYESSLMWMIFSDGFE